MADEKDTAPDAVQAEHRCPYCFPHLFEVQGVKKVMWNVDGIQISMPVSKALDLIEHIHMGLLSQITGKNIFAQVEAIRAAATAAAQDGPPAPVDGKKEYLN